MQNNNPEVYFPKEVWEIIKEYSLGSKEYWKEQYTNTLNKHNSELLKYKATRKISSCIYNTKNINVVFMESKKYKQRERIYEVYNV